jgi:hypothetical protein
VGTFLYIHDIEKSVVVLTLLSMNKQQDDDMNLSKITKETNNIEKRLNKKNFAK